MIAGMIAVFSIAAIAGIILAAFHFAEKKLPMGIAVFHGLFAIIGLLLLILRIMNPVVTGFLNFALVLLILAAINGLVLFFGFYLRKKKLSSPIVGLHALLAILGFVLVITYALSH
jgi:hypothetical protein